MRIVNRRPMTLDPVARIEAALDSFELGLDVRCLAVLRSLAAEYQHRRSGGRSHEGALSDVHAFQAAAERFDRLTLSAMSVQLLQDIHGVLRGGECASPLRTTHAGVQPNVPHAPVRPTGAPPADVLPRMEEVLEKISCSASLGRFERIALTYFETIRTHPFEDGNGRLARLSMALLLKNEFRFGALLDITRVMRTNFRAYHQAIRSEELDIYDRWLRFAVGIVTAELHALARLRKAVDGLPNDERVETLAVAQRGIQTATLPNRRPTIPMARLSSAFPPRPRLRIMAQIGPMISCQFRTPFRARTCLTRTTQSLHRNSLSLCQMDSRLQ